MTAPSHHCAWRRALKRSFPFTLLLITMLSALPRLTFARGDPVIPVGPLAFTPLISAGVTYPTGLHLELGGVLGVDFSDHTGAVGLGLAGSLGTHGTILTGGLGLSQRFMFPLVNALIGPSYLKRYGEEGGYVGGRLSLLLLFFGFDVGVFYPTNDHRSQGRLINLGFKVGF